MMTHFFQEYFSIGHELGVQNLGLTFFFQSKIKLFLSSLLEPVSMIADPASTATKASFSDWLTG